MIIYMKHPVHGTKIATLELEAVADEENGWVRYTLDEAEDFEENEESAPINNLQPKRRGRPPKNLQ